MHSLTNLPNLAKLEHFWRLNRQRFAYAAVTNYDWVFGADKATVMQSLLRWDQNQTFVHPREGEWFLVNGPDGLTKFDIVGDRADDIDLAAPIALITRQVLTLAFDHMQALGDDLFDASGVDDFISFWRSERTAGRDYYGLENESVLRATYSVRELVPGRL